MARWDASMRECGLETVFGALYAHEINAGLQSFYDGGWTAWIGDEMNGRRAEQTFWRDDLLKVAEWLAVTAEALYPALRAGDA